MIASPLKMDWRGVLLGCGSRPGDVDRDESARAAAKTFFDGSPAETPDILY